MVHIYNCVHQLNQGNIITDNVKKFRDYLYILTAWYYNRDSDHIFVCQLKHNFISKFNSIKSPFGWHTNYALIHTKTAFVETIDPDAKNT